MYFIYQGPWAAPPRAAPGPGPGPLGPWAPIYELCATNIFQQILQMYDKDILSMFLYNSIGFSYTCNVYIDIYVYVSLCTVPFRSVPLCSSNKFVPFLSNTKCSKHLVGISPIVILYMDTSRHILEINMCEQFEQFDVFHNVY